MKLKITFFIYKWLPIIFGCHTKTERTFIMNNRKFPICARCTGELVGILAFCILVFFINPTVITLILLMIPMVVDGFVQLLTKYESNNTKRFITGLLFGYALFMLLHKSNVYLFNKGIEIARNF